MSAPHCKVDDISVHVHIATYQNIIQRMASNSANAKTWCVSIVAAIIALSIGKDQYASIQVAYLPILLFLFIDTYYLALEKAFRAQYNEFVKLLHSNSIHSNDLFVIKPKGVLFIHFLKALISFSIFPFYTIVFILTIILLS